MQWLIDIQKWLYSGFAEALRSVESSSAMLSFMAAAFLFGVVHAFMPGHGKSVLVSYHLGRESRAIDGVITGTLLALTHVVIAVVLVLAGVMVISRSFAMGGRAPAFEVTSGALVATIGAFLVFKALRQSSPANTSDGKTLAVVTGLVPCPLTTFILIYAITQDRLATGLIAVAAMATGIVVTIVGFAVTAVLARQPLLDFLQRSVTARYRVGFWMELTAAIAVLALGLSMITKSVWFQRLWG